MPKFETSYSGLKIDRTMTLEELTRSVRFAIAAEFEAIQLYQQIAETTDNELAKKVMIHVANEEKEHVGELIHLLYELDPEEKDFYRNGYEDVEEIIQGIKKV